MRAFRALNSSTKVAHIRTFLDELVESGKFFELSDGGAIIEICGTSGSGKTLLCCQLCVNVSLPKDLDGPGAESIFIETDGKFYLSRLIDVYNGAVAEVGDKPWTFPTVYHYTARTIVDLEEVIGHLPELWKSNFKNVRLIVIDSLSAVYRDLMGEDFGLVVRWQNKFMAKLVRLVENFKIMIVITSQVTKRCLVSESYTHRVDRRLILRRTHGNVGIAQIDKFHFNHQKTAKYTITKEGLQSAP